MYKTRLTQIPGILPKILKLEIRKFESPPPTKKNTVSILYRLYGLSSHASPLRKQNTHRHLMTFASREAHGIHMQNPSKNASIRQAKQAGKRLRSITPPGGVVLGEVELVGIFQQHLQLSSVKPTGMETHI